MQRAPALLCCALVCLGAGCFGNEATTFPPGLEPLEANTAELPAAADTVTIVTGTNDSYSFGHARAIVTASPADVWQALKEPDVVASRRQVDAWSFTLVEPTTYELEFTLHYEVDMILTIDWDEDWRYGTVEGTPGDPELAVVRWQKTFGSTFIDLIEGAITILPHGDGETEVQFIEHVSAVDAGEDQIRTTIQDELDALVARSHGQPLPPL